MRQNLMQHFIIVAMKQFDIQSNIFIAPSLSRYPTFKVKDNLGPVVAFGINFSRLKLCA
jgi:hypothetical protein